MNFRYDINGLRAVAVIAVVLFHFNPIWLPGGFAGVDVFFVISGFLMTGIICKGIEQGHFSLWQFYKNRAYRIIPALAVLCISVVFFGWFFIGPVDYEALGKHVSTSIGFISNFRYWEESGYFDVSSKGKWLLHTWSLSVEWQFYLIYPLILLFISKICSFNRLKIIVAISAMVGFVFSVIATYKWPTAAYYLLPSRAWEMLIGGVAYLFPINSLLKNKYHKLLELIGFFLVLGSFFWMSDKNPWPGYLAALPVLGAFIVIQANRNQDSLVNNYVFQLLGKCSYSIYLWHWPVVVFLYYFSIQGDKSDFVGIILSLLLAFLSYKYIELIDFKANYNKWYLRFAPICLMLITVGLGVTISESDGFVNRTSKEYQLLIKNTEKSPYTKKCHIDSYQDPSKSCEYFNGKITWAVLGDSHAIAIAYELAENLKKQNVGLKHFTFSGCKPSYLETNNYNSCSKWYNESINYILNNDEIKNVVVNHRFTTALFDFDISDYYPGQPPSNVTDKTKHVIHNFDKLINKLASKKENVYIYYPIPELPMKVDKLINNKYIAGDDLSNINGTSLSWYLKRNEVIINHFDKVNYPSNVHILKVENIFCDKKTCYAVKDGVNLYSDDNHPSLLAASEMVRLLF